MERALNRPILGLGLSATALIVAAASSRQEPPTPTAEQATFFETRIRPILANSCFSCHGAQSQLGGLRLDSREAMVKGGVSGPAIVPGEPDKSLIIRAVRQTGGLKMPQGGKLKPDEVKDLEAWVASGAPWPAAKAAPRQPQEPLWSLKPVQNPPTPPVKDRSWIKTPLDAFVLAKLESKNLKPAPPADARTLLRRVTYDLIGLPPTPEEMDAFLADKSPTAYEKAVDRLLASPHYGERWTRHWLDVARYADTKGYLFEEDRNYYNAYTYRDWVINAFNSDLPYDQFIIQQLAADRLPEIQNGDDKRALAALGFLTVGRRFINNIPDIIDDRIDVTMRGFQAFTVACARCHDHKFDPIPTQDYYSLYAVFNSSTDQDSPISEKRIREPWMEYSQKVGEAEKQIKSIVTAQVLALRQKMKNPEEEKKLAQGVKETLQTLREEQYPDNDRLTKLKPGFVPAELERLKGLEADLDKIRKTEPQTPEFAMAMTDKAHPQDGVIFKRGNPANPGDPAPRRFLQALSKPGAEREHWTNGSGRLDLAKAIASKENPLTARVFVNRVWQDHFGAGIVRTPSDFGRQGEKPTDPALLDFLASTFMEDGWSIKKLQRQIVNSATYRQSSSVTPTTLNADPENRLWSRMNRRRLDLEQMRDSLMAASGRLDTAKVGGKSVDLWSAPFTPRRALYGFIERQNLPGIFRTFDLASPDSTSARRFQTTVPQQALFFMNSSFSMDVARALTERQELKAVAEDAKRVRVLYRILLDRAPDPDEAAAGLAYLAKGPIPAPVPAWQYGYGSFDPVANRVNFTPLPKFANDTYRGGATLPDKTLGWVMLAAYGGHPGHDAAHSAIRRWTAPAAMTITIRAGLSHKQAEGDGVRARVVSSRSGLIGEWQAHNSETRTDSQPLAVQKGDTIDFIVDPIGDESYDAFAWAPTITGADSAWDAQANFAPPPEPAPSRLALYAQALMMTNEFLFID